MQSLALAIVISRLLHLAPEVLRQRAWAAEQRDELPLAGAARALHAVVPRHLDQSLRRERVEGELAHLALLLLLLPCSLTHPSSLSHTLLTPRLAPPPLPPLRPLLREPYRPAHHLRLRCRRVRQARVLVLRLYGWAVGAAAAAAATAGARGALCPRHSVTGRSHETSHLRRQ